MITLLVRLISVFIQLGKNNLNFSFKCIWGLKCCFDFFFLQISDYLFITGGSSQGLVLLCNVLFQSGDPVFVPDLIGCSLDILRDLGLKLVSG